MLDRLIMKLAVPRLGHGILPLHIQLNIILL